MTQLIAERLDPLNENHIAGLQYIFSAIRSEDQYEIAAVGLSIEEAMQGVLGLAMMGAEVWLLSWRVGDAICPVFVWGVNPHTRGTYGLFGFGTNATKRAMPSITRWGMRTWLPDFLARTNARRIEVRVPVSSVHSINWLKRLGMIPECTLPKYSVVGEDFLQLALTVGQKHVHSRVIRDQGAHSTASRSSAI